MKNRISLLWEYHCVRHSAVSILRHNKARNDAGGRARRAFIIIIPGIIKYIIFNKCKNEKGYVVYIITFVFICIFLQSSLLFQYLPIDFWKR